MPIFIAALLPHPFIVKAPPHNSAARRAMSFPPSAACRFLDLPPVNLQNLHLHLTKNPFAGRPPHLCGVALKQNACFYFNMTRTPVQCGGCRESVSKRVLFRAGVHIPEVNKGNIHPFPHARKAAGALSASAALGS